MADARNRTPGPDTDASDDVAALLGFLRHRDVSCPVCRYNLRDLTRAQYPECRHDLELTVGAVTAPLGWFLAAVAPGFFSGISAALLLLVIIGDFATGGSGPPWFVSVTDAFGWLSGGVAVLLAMNRLAFLRQPRHRQQAWVVAIWAVHLAAFGALVLLIKAM